MPRKELGLVLLLGHGGNISPGKLAVLGHTIHIELRQSQVRIEGNADQGLVRVLLYCVSGAVLRG